MTFKLLETPTHWIAEKDMDATPLSWSGKATTRGIVDFETGLKDGKKVLRQVKYSKEAFPTRGEILNILASLESKCPLCKGSNTSFEPYISRSKQRGEVETMSEEERGSSIFQPLDALTDSPGASRAIGSELLALAIQEPVKLFTTPLGEKIVDLVAFGALTAAYFAPMGQRSKNDCLQLGMHFLNQLIDPRQEEVEAVKADIEKLRSSLSLGSGVGIFDALFKLPKINLPSLSLPTSLSMPNIQLPNLAKFATPEIPKPVAAPVLPPNLAELGNGVTPNVEIDITQFTKLDRLAMF